MLCLCVLVLLYVVCEIDCVMLHGVVCACFVFACFVLYHVKHVFVCFGDSLCDIASHVLCACAW